LKGKEEGGSFFHKTRSLPPSPAGKRKKKGTFEGKRIISAREGERV